MREIDEHAPVRSPHPELLSGVAFLACGAGLLAAARFDGHLPAAFARLFFYLSGLLLVTAAGFIPAYLTANARRRGRRPHRAFSRHGNARGWPPWEKVKAWAHQVWIALVNVDWVGDWLAVFATLLLSVAALTALWDAWRIGPAQPTALFDELSAGILLVAAFPALVLERKYAGMAERLSPEAPPLARLLRLPLLGLLGLGVAAGLRWIGLSFALPLEHAVAIVTGLVAIELFLRSIVYVFVPLPALETRRSHALSSIAGLIRLQWPNFSAISETVSRQFGIDLARSWALAFIRRAAIPVLAGMAVFCWLLTGVTALGLNQRAIYEAFGKPVAVFHPGLHLHLPWPFGVLKPVEFGIVREIPVIFESGETPATASDASSASAGIEGPAPVSADRLWDTAHSDEASYLVASNANGHESFEVVGIDMGVVYRIGLSDTAAMDAVYNVASPEEMIRAMAGRILARYFARSTITDVLGQNREAFTRAFQKELQSRLGALATGIDIMAVVVEEIHPPSGAAIAYQGVQAAAVQSKVTIATASAESEREVKMSQLVSNATSNDAIAAAAERVNQAKADFTLFDADRQAYGIGGASFLFERRLDRLDKGLMDKPLVIVDHRITPAEAPTLDLRSFQPTGARSDFAPGDD